MEALRREFSVSQHQLEERTNKIEAGSANIQGRIWAIGAVWAILAMGVSIGVRFIGH